MQEKERNFLAALYDENLLFSMKYCWLGWIYRYYFVNIYQAFQLFQSPNNEMKCKCLLKSSHYEEKLTYLIFLRKDAFKEIKREILNSK